MKNIAVRGPFLECNGELYFPRPLDFTTNQRIESGSVGGFMCRPVALPSEIGETEMPGGLLPVFIKNPPSENFKPEKLPEFWSAKKMCEWLADTDPFTLNRNDCLDNPNKDERTHTQIDPSTGKAANSMLFSTTGLDFHNKVEKTIGGQSVAHFLPTRIALEATAAQGSNYDTVLDGLSLLHPLGGERRLAEWKKCGEDPSGWMPLPPLSATANAACLRMVLATPAIFANGWTPGWIGSNMQGKIPGTDISVTLIAAIVERWLPISGYNFEEKAIYRIKPLRRMVPAGSVYFFKTDGGRKINLGDLWLKSVSDDAQDCKDGFGAALWGIWKD
jgi:CRISPR-associated protein Cmr3